ncbi:MAG: hypothetical protein U0800_19885 [Isosphaeraceae bacterium]
MASSRIGAAILALGLASAAIPAAHAGVWSPNGRWVAYPLAVAGRAPSPPARWLFPESSPIGPPAASRADMVYRLWATEAEAGESVLLDENRGPISNPGWNPDGTALAFGRVAIEPDGSGRFELVVQDRPGRKRILLTRPVRDASADLHAWACQAVAWSPDGRHLAVPLPESGGLALVRAEDGTLLKRLDAACRPAWSPAGDRLAFFTGGERDGLWTQDLALGAPRLIASIPSLGQEPVWSPDGRSLLAVHRQGGRIELRRMAGLGQPEWAYDLFARPIPAGNPLLAASVATDGDGENVFVALQVDGEPNAVIWLRPRRDEVHNRFHPFDFAVPVGSLASSPRSPKLFVRLGPPDRPGPAGIYDSSNDKWTPLTPDVDARGAWLDLILDTTRMVLAYRVPPPMTGVRPQVRPSILPRPSEIRLRAEAAGTLARMDRFARDVLDRGSAGEALTAEARFLLGFLRKDYDACLAELDALEPTVASGDDRLRILAVRAQLLAAQGDTTRASALLDYMRDRFDRPRLRIEDDGQTARLVDEPDSQPPWMAYALSAPPEGPVNPEGDIPIGNPDNPLFGLPDDPFLRIDALPQAR